MHWLLVIYAIFVTAITAPIAALGFLSGEIMETILGCIYVALPGCFLGLGCLWMIADRDHPTEGLAALPRKTMWVITILSAILYLLEVDFLITEGQQPLPKLAIWAYFAGVLHVANCFLALLGLGVAICSLWIRR